MFEAASLREKNVDHLLAEELEGSPVFADWIVRHALGERAPQGLPERCEATISHHRLGGETDIRIVLQWPGGVRAVVHVEDKIDAPPQRDQALRYRAALDVENVDLRACMVVAPLAWLTRHRAEVAGYDAAVTFESIAGFLQKRAGHLDRAGTSESIELARKLRWRCALLTGALRKRSMRQALVAEDITDWNEAAALVFQELSGLVLEVKPRQRSPGRPKDTRFLPFAVPLGKGPSGGRVRLVLKTGNDKRATCVDLEIQGVQAENSALRASAAGCGFDFDLRGKTMHVTAKGRLMARLRLGRPVADQLDELEEAGAAARSLIDWWSREGRRLAATGAASP